MNSRLTQQRAKPLGIFWDLDNCPIPLSQSSSSVTNHLLHFIRDCHPESNVFQEFFCCCDTQNVSKGVTEGLNRCGVTVVHVNTCAKNAADDKLHELMDRFVDNYGHKLPLLVVITSDINFANPIRNAIRKHSMVVLIHGIHCSDELKRTVNECYSYEVVIKCLPKLKTMTTELKSTYLKVSNLRRDLPIKDIIKRLSQLTANCGGKTDNIFNGKALIRFGCKDDAQRCLQRIDGNDCFGKQIRVQLIEDLNTSRDVQEFNICKSVLKGLTFDLGENLIQFVKQWVNEWKDPEISADIIVSVYSVDDTELLVTTDSPNSNRKLISVAKKHIIPELGMDWTEVKDYETTLGSELGWVRQTREVVSDDRRSVLKGLDTSGDEDVTEVVKNLVKEWNDSEFDPNFIVSVERNTKQNRSDEKCNLFVTATSADTSKALVVGAKQHLKEGSGIKWIAYKHKFQNSFEQFERKSVIKGLDTRSSDNFTQLVRNIVDEWNDRSIKPNFVVKVERNSKQRDSDGKINLFVTAVSANASKALVAGARRYILADHQIKWTKYNPKSLLSGCSSITTDDMSDSDVSEYSAYSTASSYVSNKSKNNTSQQNLRKTVDKPVINGQECSALSVITGLKIRSDQNVTKIVRKVVMDWKDSKINGNFIVKAERDPNMSAKEELVRVLVTATSPQTSESLIRGSKRYLKAKDGIVWTHYKPIQTLAQNNVNSKAKGRLVLTPNRVLLPNPWITPVYTHPTPLAQFSQFLPIFNPLFLNRGYTPPIAVDFSGFPPVPNAPTVNSLEPIKVSEIKRQSIESISAPIQTTLRSEKSKENVLKTASYYPSQRRLSIITGLMTKADDDVTRIVRRMVNNWKDYRVNGNFITKVERDPHMDQTDGNRSLIVTAIGVKQSEALVVAAQKHLRTKDGLKWIQYSDNMFVICGLRSQHNEDVLPLVRKLITDYNDSRLSAEDIASVTRDYRWKSRDGTAMLFVTLTDGHKKQLYLDFGRTLNVNSKIQFKERF